MGCSFRVLGVGWGERDLVVSIAGTMTWGVMSELSLVVCVRILK